MTASESPELPSLTLRPQQFWPIELSQALSDLSYPEADAADKPPLVHAVDAAGHHGALMGLNHPLRMEVLGPLGDYACAFNRQALVVIRGSVGNGVADGMQSGSVRIYGGAGAGAGVAMAGGTLAIYGHAGDRCGAGMCGGELFVRGNVGSSAGVGAMRGTIVIGGNAGQELGDAVSGASIFIRGKVASLAAGVVEAPLRERERVRLGLLLINASIRGQAKDFRRIVAREVYEHEQSQLRGEIHPSWR